MTKIPTEIVCKFDYNGDVTLKFNFSNSEGNGDGFLRV